MQSEARRAETILIAGVHTALLPADFVAAGVISPKALKRGTPSPLISNEEYNGAALSKQAFYAAFCAAGHSDEENSHPIDRRGLIA